MSEYTTEEIRDIVSDSDRYPKAGEAFDRWLEDRDHRIARDYHEQGWSAGFSAQGEFEAGLGLVQVLNYVQKDATAIKGSAADYLREDLIPWLTARIAGRRDQKADR